MPSVMLAADNACIEPAAEAHSPASPLRIKSAKRQAAEALLQRRYSGSELTSTSSGTGTAAKRQRTQKQRPAVRVPACSDCSCEGRSRVEESWCSQDVALPPMDWPAVMQSAIEDQVDHRSHCHNLPGGIRVHVVSTEDQLPDALSALRRSMQDSCLAIDLEWKPEGWAGNCASKIALMQLASGSVAVLVRICRLGFRLPPALRSLLSDPELTLVGFSWDSSDEAKMKQTFGEGRRNLFARYLDLQQIGTALGYHGLGLGALTHQVLGSRPPKCRKVTMSNWEQKRLTAKQVQYAALDAILTGNVYRSLRLWHASPSACTSCHQMLGAVLPPPEWTCRDCPRSFASIAALQNHKQQKRHRGIAGVCGECGRVHSAAAPRSSQSVP
ncbi:hypothetical protein D9Q98_009233 [Chlorella vulgaris]|uniref:C2H2-type domain-containing protein n=1 Tax=Chlorella vulgaris TaxID=3077 RepID=A0A9D4TP32_CHLVU|nr:hypothetical protein D9Q98_009233 [Chlorella vulgaris]